MSSKVKLIFILSLIGICITGASQDRLELSTLEGKWEGKGTFRVPVTGGQMDITGQADFKYDKEKEILRTALTGEKFLFTYSDSGHLFYEPPGDSITWEVWDNFGKHARYRGNVDGETIRGERMRKESKYSIAIKMIHADTIDFKLTVTNKDGETSNKATFHLWRVTEK